MNILPSAILLALATFALPDQIQISGTPGRLVAFGVDGKLTSIPPIVTVLGMPDGNRGCTATATAGRYAIPAGVVTIAVYRNGIRASLPKEFTVSGALLTITAPISGEVILCDYTR